MYLGKSVLVLSYIQNRLVKVLSDTGWESEGLQGKQTHLQPLRRTKMEPGCQPRSKTQHENNNKREESRQQYRPWDAALSRTNTNAVEQIRAREEPIVDLMLCVLFAVCPTECWLTADCPGREHRAESTELRPPRKTRSAGQRADRPGNWSNRRCRAVRLQTVFMVVVGSERGRGGERKRGRGGSFSTWLTSDPCKILGALIWELLILS